MSRDALENLVAAAQQLPLPPALPDAAITAPRGGDRRTPGAPRERLRPAQLRERVRELLFEVATRVDEALPRTLAQADVAWDQVDSMRILDRAVREEARDLRRAAHDLLSFQDPTTRALAVEAQMTIDATLDLIALFERRLATLVRLRARDEQASLLPDGRPFLDLGAALHETARRWA